MYLYNTQAGLSKSVYNLWVQLTGRTFFFQAIEKLGLAPQSPLLTPGAPLASFPQPVPSHTLLNLGSPVHPPRDTLHNLLMATEDVTRPVLMTGDETETEDIALEGRHQVALKFNLRGLVPCLSSPPFIIRMSLPLTTKNWTVYQPILSIGTGCKSTCFKF